jgi:hypothetical protein
MSRVRPFVDADVEAVAALHRLVFQMPEDDPSVGRSGEKSINGALRCRRT